MPQPPSSADTAASADDRPRRRPLFPIVVVGAAILGILALQWVETSESLASVQAALAAAITPFLARLIVVGVSAIALFVWFLFFAPFSRSARRAAGS